MRAEVVDPELRREFPRCPRGAELAVWQDWLRRHGVDPDEVRVDFIERRPEQRQLVYSRLRRERSDDGRGYEVHFLGIHVEQLEGVPLPFPAPAG